MADEQVLLYSARPLGNSGHAILDHYGRVVAWACDGYLALLLMAMLNPLRSRSPGTADGLNMPMSQRAMNNRVVSITEPGDSVCDPLAGSFTTAEACHLTGRSCVAGDVDPACLEKAKVRFNRLLSGLYDQLAQDAGFDSAEGEPRDLPEEFPT